MTVSNKHRKFFYGWIVVAVALLSLIVSNGLSLLGVPVFYKFVQNELVAAGAVAPEKIQTVYGLAPAITTLLSGFFAPVGGFLLQKYQPKIMMIAGCLILGAGLIVYSQAHTPLAVYAAHALMGVSLGFVGVLVSAVLVSNWFVKKRGIALGIALTGTSFGGVLIPQIAAPLIQNYGWRKALMLTSLLIWLILLPAIIFLVKNHPDELGLIPDGRKAAEISDGQSPEILAQNGLTLPEALANPMFWVFAICAALIFYAIFAVSQQLNLYLQSPKLNFTPAEASFAQSLLFAFSVGGKFIFGWLSDRFAVNRVMILSAATMFLSSLIFLFFNSQTAYLFAVLFGLTYGGTFVLLQILTINYFGAKEYGKILGALTVVETVGGALGTFITGKITDAGGGDFANAFDAVIIVTGIALMLVVLLNVYDAKLRGTVKFLPILAMPAIGALTGVIVGPILTEIVKVLTSAEFSLQIPLIFTGAVCGVILGFLSRRQLAGANSNKHF